MTADAMGIKQKALPASIRHAEAALGDENVRRWRTSQVGGL
jgi:hypothetical protein